MELLGWILRQQRARCAEHPLAVLSIPSLCRASPRTACPREVTRALTRADALEPGAREQD